MQIQEVVNYQFPSDPRTLTLVPVTTIVDHVGNPWFAAKEVCDILGYSNTAQPVQYHCKYPEILKSIYSIDLGFSPRAVLVIPESDLYRLIMRSKVTAVEPSQDWVTEEVLPLIRKTGTYTAAQSQVEQSPQPSQSTLTCTPMPAPRS